MSNKARVKMARHSIRSEITEVGKASVISSWVTQNTEL